MSSRREWTAFEDTLRRRRLRLTAPRRRIAERMLSMRGHLSADEIQDLLKRDGTPVSKATVYRTLSLLKECGLFDSHDFGNGRKVYEKAVGRAHHDHLFCVSCGKVLEFHEPRIEEIQDQVTRRFRFSPVYHSHKIFGTCADCTRGKPGEKKGEHR